MASCRRADLGLQALWLATILAAGLLDRTSQPCMHCSVLVETLSSIEKSVAVCGSACAEGQRPLLVSSQQHVKLANTLRESGAECLLRGV